MATTRELVEDGKIYVLRENPQHAGCHRGRYYTGKNPASSIKDAKLFKLQNAKNVRKFAHTGWCYDVVRVTNKQMFVMLLSGE